MTGRRGACPLPNVSPTQWPSNGPVNHRLQGFRDCGENEHWVVECTKKKVCHVLEERLLQSLYELHEVYGQEARKLARVSSGSAGERENVGRIRWYVTRYME